MTSFSLFKSSFAILLRYKNTALTLIILSFLMTFLSRFISEKLNASYLLSGSFGSFALGTIALLLVSVFIGAIIAVAWHRRVLLDEDLHFSSDFLIGKPVLSYLLGIVIIIALAIGVGIVFSLLAALLGGLIAGTGSIGAAVFVGIMFLVLYVFVSIYFTRISLILPARAVDKKITVGDALNATEGKNLMLLGYILLIVLVALVLFSPLIFQMLNDPMGMMGPQSFSPAKLVLISIGSAILTMAQVGAMTLLYAEYVEN